MAYYNVIYDHAADNYGLFTSSDARELDIPVVELGKLAHRGRLHRLGYGVYRIEHYIPTPLDKYADAVALVGDGARLYGESVLAFHDLTPTNPSTITVATPKYVRKKLPPYIVTIQNETEEPAVLYEGIPSQGVVEAIRACKPIIMPERLVAATVEARKQGLISKQEEQLLLEEIQHGK